MSSLPKYLQVALNQFALSEDVNEIARRGLLALLQTLAGAKGIFDSVASPAADIDRPLQDPRLGNVVVSGLDITYRSTNTLAIQPGTVIFGNEAADTADFGLVRQVALLENEVPVGLPTGGPFWSLIMAQPSTLATSEIRKFIVPAGGTTMQSTVVYVGQEVIISRITSAGEANPSGFSPLPDTQSIPLALVFHNNVLITDINQVIDVRPFVSRGPGIGEVEFSSAYAASDQARVSWSTPYQDQPNTQSHNNPEWHTTALTIEGGVGPRSKVPCVHSMVTSTTTTYQAGLNAAQYPALNTIWSDGSWQRDQPLWATSSARALTGPGTELTALPDGLNWIYVYNCRSRSTGLQFYVLSPQAPTTSMSIGGSATAGLYTPAEKNGWQSFPNSTNAVPPPPLQASTAEDDLIGFCCGLLPLTKSGATYQWKRHRYNGNKLVFPEPLRIGVNGAVDGAPFEPIAQSPLFEETNFVGLTASETSQVLPQWGILHLRGSSTAQVVDDQSPRTVRFDAHISSASAVRITTSMHYLSGPSTVASRMVQNNWEARILPSDLSSTLIFGMNLTGDPAGLGPPQISPVDSPRVTLEIAAVELPVSGAVLAGVDVGMY